MMDGNRKENYFCSSPVGSLNQPNDDGNVSKQWLWKISNCFSTVEQILPSNKKTKNYMESNKPVLELKDFSLPSHRTNSNFFASVPSSDLQPFPKQPSSGLKVSWCPHCSLQIHNGGGCIHSVRSGALEHTNTGTVTCQISSRPTFHTPKSCKIAIAKNHLDGAPCHLTSPYVKNIVSSYQLQPPLSQKLSCCGTLFKQSQPYHGSVPQLHQVPMLQSYNTSSLFSCTELTAGVSEHLEDHRNQADQLKRVCTDSLPLHVGSMYLKSSHCCDDCVNKPSRRPVLDPTKIWPNIPPPTQSVPVSMSTCNGAQSEGQMTEMPILTGGSLGLQPQKYGSSDVGTPGQQQENLPPIGVFWDIENCSVPTGRSAMTIVQRIRQQFFHGHREAEFMCVCDISKENKEVIQELNNCQVTVAHINATAKNAADDKLRQSLRRFAETHTAPSTVVLVSSDVNFASELSDLRHRHGFQIILVHKNQVSDALLQHAHKHIKFEEFVSNLPPRLPEKTQQCHTLLYAYNLPLNRDSKQVGNRLRRLSDNCGGKVLSITGSSAILRFTSQESAERAQKRMENEDVFGNKILVSFTPKHKDFCESKTNCITVEKTKSPKKASKLTKQSQLNKDLDEQSHNEKNSAAKNTRTTQGSAVKNGKVRSLQELCGMESKTKQSGQAPQIKKQGTESPPINHSVCSPATSKNTGNGKSFNGNVKSLSPSLSNRSSPISTTQNHYSDVQTDPFANGADVQVSNLDYRMSRKELHQILHEIFFRHGKVKNVELSPHTDYQLKAMVQMESLQEAISAVNSLHRYRIGCKRIQVSLATGNVNKSLALLSSEAILILQDAPACCLPLLKFTELYEKRFARKLIVSDLYKLTDTVAIRDQVNGRMVCLLPSSQARQSPLFSVLSYDGSSANCSPVIFEGLEYHEPICKLHCTDKCYSENEFDPDSYKIPFIISSLKTFAPQVHSLLHTHEGTVPLLSFLDCYASEFTVLKTVEEGEGGVPLEHLITCVPGVNIVTAQNGIKVVKWVHNNPPPPNADHCLPRCKSPVGNPQLIQFSREIIDLMKNQAHCLISQDKFIPTYHHHFGKQCRVSDYGYFKLMELLEAVPHVLQVLGLGTKRLLTLTHRAQVKRFTQDILKLLKSQASKQVFVREFGQAYHWCFSKDWDITDYGVCELADLLSEIPDTTICISKQDEDTVISIPKRDRTPEEIERTKQFAKEVLECGEEKNLVLTENEQIKALTAQLVKLLRSQKDNCMKLSDFLSEYNTTYGYNLRLQDYDVNTIGELMQRFCHIAKVTNTPSGKQLQLINRKSLRTLTAQLLVLLMSLDDTSQLTIDELKKHFDSTYESPLVPSEYGFVSMAELLKSVSYFVEVFTDDKGEEYVKLTKVYQFAKNVRALLHTYHYQQVFLTEFPSTYHKYTGEVLQPKVYGYASIEDLLVAIPQVIWIKGHGQKRIVVLKNDMKVRNNSTNCSPALMFEEPEQIQENPKRPVTLVLENSSEKETEFETSDSCVNQIEQELLSLRNHSPIDLLCGPVPSCLPSPQLRPDPVIPESADLIQFEEPNVADMLILTEEEKTILPAAMTEEVFTSGSVNNQMEETVPSGVSQDVRESRSPHVQVTNSPVKKPRNKVKLAANFSMASPSNI